MLRDIWARRSIRFWMAVSLSVAIVPLGTTGLLGYFAIKHGMLDSFKDIAYRQYNHVISTQKLQVSLWETLTPIDLYVTNKNPSDPGAFSALRQQIEEQFARLHSELKSMPEAQTLLERSRADWSTADRLATETILVQREVSDDKDAELIDKFRSLIASANDKLGVINKENSLAINKDYSNALHAYERLDWITGIAATISLLLSLTSIWMVGRILVSNIDRLVDGATRFGAGQRDVRVEIAIPPELHKVADVFNRMMLKVHESEMALVDLARRDQLTGLFNRRAFDESLIEACARIRRLDEKFALLMIDIDHFKRVNDTFGHAVGDGVLRMVSRVMISCFREIDSAFRIGGEEFAVLLLGADMEAAKIAADRLRAAIATEYVTVESQEIRVTVSIGIALSSPLLSSVETLTKVADAALYKAKTEGRNQCVLGNSEVLSS